MNPKPRNIEAYITKKVSFKFRGKSLAFALSQGLFSSADIDAGTRLLLKVFSKTLDAMQSPKTVLDAGCGVGVIGICAAASADCAVRCQDRDELARGFTEYNARQNRIPPERLSARAEPLLAGNPADRWDLILSNIPAKAGKPVLADFIQRSAGLLTPSGRALIVAVNPLADFFRSAIETLLYEETGPGHTVFVYGPSEKPAEPILSGPRFLEQYPAYLRRTGDYRIEETAYAIDAVHGAGDFDSPRGTVPPAAKLIVREAGKRLRQSDAPLAVLIQEPGQGHFPVWLSEYLPCKNEFTLAGRNILALEASRHNLRRALSATICSIVDLETHRDVLVREKGYDFIAGFPETVPQTDRLRAHWDGLESLLSSEGVAVLSFPSAEAERFDRKKPKSFARIGDVKRNGFRALAYRKNSL
ncbi:MAG: methyltransferase [Spirochaetaceae bacterium]|jgi:16S rRNA G1207 methylase RsmC|nr:methyltransferase [Spirochaetaceae bacterium]